MDKKIIGILGVVIVLVLGYFLFMKKDVLVLDESKIYDYAEKGEINEDVHISRDGVVLKNAVLNKDLYIDEEVLDGHIELENVEVKGTLYVYGGGLETILIKDGKIFQLIGYVDARVLATRETEVEEVIVKQPGMVLESDMTSDVAFANVSIDIEEAKEDDEPVLLNGSFEDVSISSGNKVEVAEYSRIRNIEVKACSKEDCSNELKTKVTVRRRAMVESMEFNHSFDFVNSGDVLQYKYGKDITPTGEFETKKGDQNYSPQVLDDFYLDVSLNGDYSMDLETNSEGTLHYVIQPYFETTETPSVEDVVSGKGIQTEEVKSQMCLEDDNCMMVVSAKNVEVNERRVSITGYMGDKQGQRPPQDTAVRFDSVVWYVLEDKDGNYGKVGKAVFR